jgi:hypothetical protein
VQPVALTGVLTVIAGQDFAETVTRFPVEYDAFEQKYATVPTGTAAHALASDSVIEVDDPLFDAVPPPAAMLMP